MRSLARWPTNPRSIRRPRDLERRRRNGTLRLGGTSEEGGELSTSGRMGLCGWTSRKSKNGPGSSLKSVEEVNLSPTGPSNSLLESPLPPPTSPPPPPTTPLPVSPLLSNTKSNTSLPQRTTKAPGRSTRRLLRNSSRFSTCPRDRRTSRGSPWTRTRILDRLLRRRWM
ncbi:hypothetical protein BDY24DRAFT_382353 [Mrakia frigida]|uniref:uncharacterized protein n=1 Tax=Mrakia frigida TaxID=29902 RepID=UPI003FCBF296